MWSRNNPVTPGIKVTHTRLSVTKTAFLSNTQNKKAFIHLSGKMFGESCVQVLYARDDADRLIAMALGTFDAVVGEDKMSLLCYGTL